MVNYATGRGLGEGVSPPYPSKGDELTLMQSVVGRSISGRRFILQSVNYRAFGSRLPLRGIPNQSCLLPSFPLATIRCVVY